MAITLLWFALAIYVGVFVALASMQRSFMYFPQRGEERNCLPTASQHKVQPVARQAGKSHRVETRGAKRAYNRMLILSTATPVMRCLALT
jgi:hypothetical protein